MQRKVQFNAWDVANKKMITGVTVYENGDIGFSSIQARNLYGNDYSKWPGGQMVAWITMPAHRVILLQSSEVPDKNGHMKYDGHIVKCVHEDPMEQNGLSETYHHITFRNGCFGWIGEITGQFHPFSEDEMRDCEIVGNIFENPELLELNKRPD